MTNKFINCEEKIILQDISFTEKEVSFSFSKGFYKHYEKYNGGTPEKAFLVDEEENFDPVEVAEFIPVKSNNSKKKTIAETYNELTKKGVIPKNIIPFARDWGLGWKFFLY